MVGKITLPISNGWFFLVANEIIFVLEYGAGNGYFNF